MKTLYKNVKATVEVTGQEVPGNLMYEEIGICGGLLVETKYNLIFRSNERIRKFAGFSKITLDNGYEFIGYCGVHSLIARDGINGKYVPIGNAFHVGDSWMMFPKDTSLGADAKEIINCRCSITYS